MTEPQLHYARSGEADIAYHVGGHGPIDLVVMIGYLLPIESWADEPSFARFASRLESFARVIRFDRRGTGLSKTFGPSLPTLEEWVQDCVAVMDDVGTARASLLSLGPGADQLFGLLAAAHPSRVGRIALINPTPRPLRSDDQPFGFDRDDTEHVLDAQERSLRTGEDSGLVPLPEDPLFHAWWLRWRRRSASPTTGRAIYRTWLESDVRSALASVRAPALVVSQSARFAPYARLAADSIPGARYVEIASEFGLPFLGDAHPLLDAVEEFLTGAHAVHDADRVLATVMFTDIASSTRIVAQLGDRRWTEVLDRHDAVVTRDVERFRGRRVANVGLGDGVLATFDGPARAVQCAQSILRDAREIGLEVRAGIHTGEIEVRGDDVAGIAVHIAARVLDLAEPGEILVSRTVTDLVAGSGLEFEGRGAHELRGVPGEWTVFRVVS